MSLKHRLELMPNFSHFSSVFLNAEGKFVSVVGDIDTMTDGIEVAPEELIKYLKRQLSIPEETTDVFVWAHGWRNKNVDAINAASRYYKGMKDLIAKRPESYPKVSKNFQPYFVIVRWPSMSTPGLAGYTKIRKRASHVTEKGDAEFFLASLLGYLDSDRSKTLRTKAGFYLHCLGHSFGGRFLTSAVSATGAHAIARTKHLLAQVGHSPQKLFSADEDSCFNFTIDSVIAFQMAAPATSFGKYLEILSDPTKTAIRGPVVLTHSKFDDANCVWHLGAEGEDGIGGFGAKEPRDRIVNVNLLSEKQEYEKELFKSQRIVNVNADDIFKNKETISGSHGDIFHPESAHLILSVIEAMRY